MKRLLIVLLLSSPVFAQDHLRQNVTTTSISGARFEIFQSTVVVKVTFKLDKYTGQVWEIVRHPETETFVWQFIRHSGVTKAIATNKVSYQLFTSGIAVRHTYLLNIHTGVTWQHVHNKDGNSRWQYVEFYG